MTGGIDRSGSRMTDSSYSSHLSPKDLIEQARGIIMNRFDLDAAQALKLRRMSLDPGRRCAWLQST